MKSRNFLLALFWPAFIAFAAAAVITVLYFDRASAGAIPTIVTIATGGFALLVAIMLIVAARTVYLEKAELEKQARDLPAIIQRLQAEVTTKDALLAREKEILIAKHKKLEEAFDAQKKVNADLEKLWRNYENILELNKTVWFLDSPLAVIELITEESLKAVGGDRAVVVIHDEKGVVTLIGTSVATEEQRAPLKKMFGQTAFTRQFVGLISSERFVRLERPLIPQPIAEFLSCGHGADCFGFPIRFHKELRGAAFIATRRDSGLIVKNLTLLEMFFSLVAVYLERSELIDREQSFNDLLSEQEKMMSITHLTEGIAKNITVPLSTIMRSHELIETALNGLSSRYPDDMLVPRLRRTMEQIRRETETIDAIVSNITKKAALDKVEKADYLDINELIRSELIFLNADIEFKNSYEKELDLGENLPVVHGVYRDFSYLVDAHINLAMHFLKNEDPRRILFKTRPHEEGVRFEIGISGGVTAETLRKLLDGEVKQHIPRVNILTLNRTLEQNGITREIYEKDDFVRIAMRVPVKG